MATTLKAIKNRLGPETVRMIESLVAMEQWHFALCVKAKYSNAQINQRRYDDFNWMPLSVDDISILRKNLAHLVKLAGSWNKAISYLEKRAFGNPRLN